MPQSRLTRIGGILLPTLIGAIIALSTLEHALYVGTAQNFPRDLNLAYRPLPVLYDQLDHGFWMPALHSALQPGGWYNGLIAAWLHLTGPSGIAFSAMAVPWFSLLLVSVARLGWRWGGPTTALAATALVAQLPVLLLSSRLGWIHMPEAALVTAAAAAWAGDRELTSRRNVLGIAIAGALAIMLRPSGALWFTLLGAAGLVATWGARPRALGIVLGSWTLAALVPAPIFADYVKGKLGVAERYGEDVPGLAAQLLDHLHGAGIVLIGLGLGSLAFEALRRAPGLSPHDRADCPIAPPARRFVRLVLASWVLAALAMYAVIRCGIDNFPLFYVGLALMAAAGLSGGQAGPWLSALVTLVWLQDTALRVYQDLTHHPDLPSTRVVALLDATCPDRSVRHRCVVIVDGGLFVPRSEEPGGLELFLMQEAAVDLMDIRQRRATGMRPDAVATWACGPDLAARPGSTGALAARWALTPAFEDIIDGCRFSWLTPAGALAAPDRAEASAVPRPDGTGSGPSSVVP